MSRIGSAAFEALGVGIVSGMRAFLMPALMSRSLPANRRKASARGPAHLLRSPGVSNVLVLASAGELVGDKLPWAPDRTVVHSLAARAVSGGTSAAEVASWRGRALMPAAVLGAVGALGSAHVMVRLRRAAGRRLDIPDPIVGLVEDGFAFALGYTLITTAERNQSAHGWNHWQR